MCDETAPDDTDAPPQMTNEESFRRWQEED